LLEAQHPAGNVLSVTAMDPAASSLVACSHSQPRLGLLRQFVAW
jgi:hypothetical protein